MTEKKTTATIRMANPFAAVIDINGELNSFTEKVLTNAYEEAAGKNIQKIILNFTGLTYMNSFGIGMLVTLLIRARRQGKELVAYGLTDHYKGVFDLTRLNQVIPVYESEAVALARSTPEDLPEREY